MTIVCLSITNWLTDTGGYNSGLTGICRHILFITKWINFHFAEHLGTENTVTFFFWCIMFTLAFYKWTKGSKHDAIWTDRWLIRWTVWVILHQCYIDPCGEIKVFWLTAGHAALYFLSLCVYCSPLVSQRTDMVIISYEHCKSCCEYWQPVRIWYYPEELVVVCVLVNEELPKYIKSDKSKTQFLFNSLSLN